MNNLIKSKPFIKWAGGKRNIITQLKQNMPANFNKYYEVFVGGGALFFELSLENSFISDLNKELITTYKVIKDNLDSLIFKLKEHYKNNSESYFYNVRANYKNLSDVEVAARFIYLNKTCYNGLYRVNKSNEFNTPWGHYKKLNIVDEVNLFSCSKILQKATISNISYNEIKYEKDDFVYLDPPYYNTYSNYTKFNFKKTCHVELRDFCNELTNKNVKFMLSNSDNDFIKNLYKDYKIIEILANRSINCNGSSRSKEQELLITNY